MTKLPSKARIRRDQILAVLARGPATGPQIAEATGLTDLEVRSALRTLVGGNVVSAKKVKGGMVYERWDTVIARLKARERGHRVNVKPHADQSGWVVA